MNNVRIDGAVLTETKKKGSESKGKTWTTGNVHVSQKEMKENDEA